MPFCPCGKQKEYSSCCGPFITGQTQPETPEQLMRSRYTAYSRADIDYIQKTMLGPAIERFDPRQAKRWAQNVVWLGLEVLNSKTEPEKGWVEFIAHLAEKGKKQTIHELSEFHLVEGRWLYFDRINS